MIPDLTFALNALAATWWDWFSAVTWQASLFIGAVAVLDRLLGRHVWPQVRYAVWLLVFVKLLLPPDLASPWSVVGNIAGGTSSTPFVETAGQVATTPLAIPYDALVGGGAEQATPGTIETIAVNLDPLVPFMLLWALGMAAFGARLAVTARRLNRLWRQAEDATSWMTDAMQRAAGRIGLARTPRIGVTDAVETAAVYGLLRPAVFSPPNLGRDDAEHVFLHELAHVKRGDLIAHACAVLVLCVFWPNPLVWYALRRTMHVRELCTDATVSRLLRDRTPAYRDTLLNAARSWLGAPRSALSPMGLLGLVEEPSMIVERLKHLTTAPWRNARLRSTAALAVTVAVGVFVLPMCETQTGELVSGDPSARPAGEPHQIMRIGFRNGTPDTTYVTSTTTVRRPLPPEKPEGDPSTWSSDVRAQYVQAARDWHWDQRRAQYEAVEQAIQDGRMRRPTFAEPPPGDVASWTPEQRNALPNAYRDSLRAMFREAVPNQDPVLRMAVLMGYQFHDPDARATWLLSEAARAYESERTQNEQARAMGITGADTPPVLVIPPNPVVAPDGYESPAGGFFPSGNSDTLTVQVTVGADGRVNDVRHMTNAPMASMNTPAEIVDEVTEAAMTAEYAPALLEGRAVAARTGLRVAIARAGG